jgi:hypothetical protein
MICGKGPKTSLLGTKQQIKIDSVISFEMGKGELGE